VTDAPVRGTRPLEGYFFEDYAVGRRLGGVRSAVVLDLDYSVLVPSGKAP
jgi:hypothetical protein